MYKKFLQVFWGLLWGVSVVSAIGVGAVLSEVMKGVATGDWGWLLRNWEIIAAFFTASILLITLLFQIIRDMRQEFSSVKIKTLDYISNTHENYDTYRIFEDFRSILDNYSGNITFADVYKDYQVSIENSLKYAEVRYRTDFDCILQILNLYESWAIGIRNSALDHVMLREWWREPYVRHFCSLVGFVRQYRKILNRPEAYEYYEKLALKWALIGERKLIDKNRRGVRIAVDDDNIESEG